MKLLKIIATTLIFFSSYIAIAEEIASIEIKGNERISTTTVSSYLEFSRGEEFTREKADESIKNLFDTGYFSDVKIDMDENKLLVKLKENPMISKVAFDGNKRIEDSEIIDELSMKPRTVLSTAKLQDDVNKIIALYQRTGHYSVDVEPKIIKLDQNRVNLVYEINEGHEARIQKINFSGNKAFTDSKLADVIFSREHRWYKFFSKLDVYDPDKTEYDKELLRKFYHNKGYADMKVVLATAELSPSKNSFLMTFKIDEGFEYIFSEYDLAVQIKNLNPDAIKKVVLIKPGRRFNQEDIDDSIDEITDFISDHGFPFSEVDSSVRLDKKNRTAKVTFTIRPSYKMYINKIIVKNNTRTLDKVIRRELTIAEGDPYNISKIKRSKQKLENLNFFNKVELKNKQAGTAGDKIDLTVEVEETATGYINFAGGYDTTSGAVGQVSLKETNFIGTGKEVSFGVSQAQRSSAQNFSLTDPYFMDYNLSAGFDLFNKLNDLSLSSNYKQRRTGFALRAGYEITEYLSHGLRYQLRKENIFDVSAGASVYVLASRGITTVSSLGQSFSYNRLDNDTEPTDGYFIRVSQEVAGLGGSVKFLQHEAMYQYFTPIKRKDIFLQAGIKGGNIRGFGGKFVRLADRFMMGQDLVRGFDMGGMGPRDLSNNNALGGNNYAGASVEILSPLKSIDETVKGILFLDVGTVWGFGGLDAAALAGYGAPGAVADSKTLRISIGPAMQWKSPFGIINLSYGIPLKKESFDSVQKFYFNFGTRF